MVSVTDHNCVKANEKAAREKGISYIPGIEIDCTYKDTNFHVLGYGIDFRSCDFEKIEKYKEHIMYTFNFRQTMKPSKRN